MRWLDKLERHLRFLGIPNLTILLIAVQVVIYLSTYLYGNEAAELFVFHPELVLEGEIWRVFVFLLTPPPMMPLFAFFFWYLLYLMGNELENRWGDFRYTMYLLIGYVANVACALILASYFEVSYQFGNAILLSTVFLAFAWLYPEFIINVFLILPVKIKWLALLTWLSYLYMLIVGDLVIRVSVIASVSNFALFFGSEIIQQLRSRFRRRQHQAKLQRPRTVHQCVVCGITSQSHPDMDFRYCTKCEGTQCYCAEHLRTHTHAEAGEDSKS